MRHVLFTATVVSCLAALAAAEAAPGTLEALTREQAYTSHRSSSSHPDLTRNADAWPIEPEETIVLLEAEGPGVVTHFWNTVAAMDPFYGRSIVLRIYYDGNEHPSVVAPLGDFFGVGHGAYAEFTSLPVTVSSHGRSRTCYWRIPFKEHIRITATNESTEHRVGSFYFYINWQKHESLPEDTSYFHALYRQEFPAQPGNYKILETEGSGHYVGTVLSTHQVETGWFGEGDDFFYIDGADYPQLRGTGTEDYFNDAWGFREFSTPYHGVPLYEGVFAGDRVTAYRWHIPDPVVFRESLRLEIEHFGSVYDGIENLGGFVERPDWVSSVAFWYQYPPVSFEAPLPPVEERTAPYRILNVEDMTYRAEPEGMIMTPRTGGITYAPGTHEASIEFEFEVEEDGRYQINGLFFHAIFGGKYEVYLNGEKLGKPLDLVIINADTLWRTLDQHDLKAGTQTLRFVGTDAPSPDSRDAPFPRMHTFGLHQLILLRLEDMAGYQETLLELRERR